MSELQKLKAYRRIAIGIAVDWTNHERRIGRMKLLGNMIRQEQTVESSEYQDTLYALKEILAYAINSGATHSGIKQALWMFVTTCNGAMDKVQDPPPKPSDDIPF